MILKTLISAVLVFFLAASSMAANAVFQSGTIDEAALAIIHNLAGCTIDSYTGHVLTMSKEAGGLAGFAASALSAQGRNSGEMGRIEYVFTMLQSKTGVEVFGHINSTLLLDNGAIKRSRLPDGDLQVFLDQTRTK